MKKATIPGIAAALLLSAAGLASGMSADITEDILFQEIPPVVTASKTEETISEAPAVMSVITRDEILSYGAVTLADVLNRVPGLQSLCSWARMDNKTIMGGAYMSRADNQVLILLNGRPFRDAYDSTSSFNLSASFPVSLIERIEIIHGPGSVLYGPNAVAGVINIITRRTQERQEFEAMVGGGDFGTHLGAGTAFLKGGGWDAAVNLNYAQTQGEGAPGYAATAGSMSGMFHAGDRFSAQVFHSDTKRIFSVDSAGDDAAAHRTFVDAGYVQPLAGSWELDVNCDVNSYDRRTDKKATGASAHNDSLAVLLEAAAKGRLDERTDVVVGALAEQREGTIAESEPGVPPFDFSGINSAAYVQMERHLFDSLKIVAGAQYNRAPSGASDTVPRFGAVYEVSDAVAVKVLCGQAFRVASPEERFADEPGVLRGDSGLSSEKVTALDAQLLIKQHAAEYSLLYFQNCFTDLIEQVGVRGGPGETFENSGEKTIYGCGLKAKGRISRSFSFTGSVTLQKEKNDSLAIPEYMAKAGIAYRRGNFNGGVFHIVTGAPRRFPGRDVDCNLLSVNLSYTFPLTVPVELTVYGNNLLDDPTNYIEQYGRRVYAAFRVRW